MKLLTYIMLCLIWGSTWLAIKLGLEDAPAALERRAAFYSGGRTIVRNQLLYRSPLSNGLAQQMACGLAGDIHVFRLVAH